MAIEDRAKQTEFKRTLTYTYDRTLKKGKGGFYFVYDEAGLRCSEAADSYGDICMVSPNKQNVVGASGLRFVYLDCGAWADDADGQGKASSKCRDFGLVCGPHVYLCEFVDGGSAPDSKVSSVQKFFAEMASKGCGVQVLAYVHATDFVVLQKDTLASQDLYLFMPDSHMPPADWFWYGNYEIGRYVFAESRHRNPPEWLANTPVFQRQTDYHYRNLYSLTQLNREDGVIREAHPGVAFGNPDIYRSAGRDQVKFLKALCSLSDGVRQSIHFIHLGDMFEIWQRGDYQYKDGAKTIYIDDGSPDRIADWGLEVMIQHTPVIAAFRDLDDAGFAEVQYLWGNHDAYLRDTAITVQLGLPSRVATYSGLGGDLFVEHGHRFDRSNWDGVAWTAGPTGAKIAYNVPPARKAEKYARLVGGMDHPEEVDCYLLGASLVYLNLQFDQGERPFRIYVQGHTHARKLFAFRIATEYHLYAVPPTADRQEVTR